MSVTSCAFAHLAPALIVADLNRSAKENMTPDNDTLWKQYALNVDLYKFYMELTVKLNLFYYGITGAILSFYFSHPASPFVALALGLPLLMSIMLAGIFFYGASLVPVLREDQFALRDKLGLAAAPDLGILTITLRGSGTLFGVVAIILMLFLVFGKQPNQPLERNDPSRHAGCCAPVAPAGVVAHL